MKTSAYTPFQVGTRDRVVGFFVIGAFLLFLVGFFIPLVQRIQADEGVPFYTVLDQTYGIAKDATVTMRGVLIGNVTEVGMTTDGMVRVDFKLSPVYRDFYTNRSRLSVDTNISASSLLTGSGLILHPGSRDNGVMKDGDFVVADTPQSFGSILEEIDIVMITDQVTEIVSNVEEITSGINENQDKIYRSLDNLEETTSNVAQVTNELPGMVESVDQSLVSLQNSLAGVDKLIGDTNEDMQLVLKNSVALTEQATATLAEAEILMRSTTPMMNQLPTVLVTTEVALQSITELTDQLSRSWLLGGGGGNSPSVIPIGPAVHPHDDSLYDLDTDN
jgi:ABC-type transporter Mla subunit MlaD